MVPDEYCDNGKFYSISNIYYDTEDNHVISTSVSKPYYKEKLRLRCYGVPDSLNDKVFLELKKKTAGMVHKRRAVITLSEAYEFTESGKMPDVDDYLGRQVLKEIAYFLECNKVKPAIYIGYNRMALFGKEDRNFRITFDMDIVTRRHKLGLEQGCFGDRLIDSNKYIMEVKITNSVPLWLSQLLSEHKVYKTSFSKYGTEFKNYCLGQTDTKMPIAVG